MTDCHFSPMAVIAVVMATGTMVSAAAISPEGILGQHSRWDFGAAGPGDYYAYLICHNGKLDRCYEAHMSFYDHPRDSTGISVTVTVVDRLLQHVYVDGRYVDFGDRVTGIMHDDLFYMGYADLHPTEKTHEYLVDSLHALAVQPGQQPGNQEAYQYAKSLEDTVLLVGGKVRIGDGTLLQHDPVLEVGRVWTGDRSTTRVMVTEAVSGYAYGSLSLDSKTYRIEYYEREPVLEMLVSGDVPLPLEGTVIGDSGLLIGDRYVQDRFWYRMIATNHPDFEIMPDESDGIDNASDITQEPGMTMLPVPATPSAPVPPPHPDAPDSESFGNDDDSLTFDVLGGVQLTLDDLKRLFAGFLTSLEIAGHDVPKTPGNGTNGEDNGEVMQPLEEWLRPQTPAMAPDAGRPDAGRPDAGRPDAGRPDANAVNEEPLTIMADRNDYLRGDTIVFSGSTLYLPGSTTMIRVTSEDETIAMVPAIFDRDGHFSTSVRTDTWDAVGTLHAVMSHAGHTAATLFDFDVDTFIFEDDAIQYFLDGRLSDLEAYPDRISIYADPGNATRLVVNVPHDVAPQNSAFDVYADYLEISHVAEQSADGTGHVLSADIAGSVTFIQILFSPGDMSRAAAECSGSARCIDTVITDVIDGDTIRVHGSQNVRFALASAPETDEPGGLEATRHIEDICPPGSMVRIDEDDLQTAGSYGRTIAVVHCNGTNLNEELLDSGLGHILTRFCSTSEFADTPWAVRHGC